MNYLLQLAYNDTFHQDNAKTRNRLTQYYYRFNLWSDVELCVRTCPICQRLGKDFKLQFASLVDLPILKDNGDTLIVDVMRPWPICTKTGNRFVFTVTDAFPIKQHASENCADSLLNVFNLQGYATNLIRAVSCAEN